MKLAMMTSFDLVNPFLLPVLMAMLVRYAQSCLTYLLSKRNSRDSSLVIHADPMHSVSNTL
jgi:hypothetical protein